MDIQNYSELGILGLLFFYTLKSIFPKLNGIGRIEVKIDQLILHTQETNNLLKEHFTK